MNAFQWAIQTMPAQHGLGKKHEASIPWANYQCKQLKWTINQSTTCIYYYKCRRASDEWTMTISFIMETK